MAATAFLVLAAGAPAADWPQWRGPARDGVAPGFTAPREWPGKLERLWKVEVGEGHATPIVAGDAVFCLTRRGEEEAVARLDLATGAEKWVETYPAPYTMSPVARAHGKGPKSTPLHAGGRLYTLGISGILSAFDAAAGKLLWRQEFSKEFPQTSPLYGTAMSPIADGGLVIAHVGGHDKGALAAFDAATGDVRWRWDGDGPGYASPVIGELAGTRQLITQTQGAIVGIDPAAGKLVWRLPFTTPYDQNIVTPLIAGGAVICSGIEQGTFALRLEKTAAGGLEPRRAWETREVSMYMSSPVLKDGLVYGFSEKRRGQHFCLDLAKGETLWTGPGRQGENAALWLAGDVIFSLDTNSQLVVFAATDEDFEERARWEVAGTPTWAHPVIAGKAIYVKDETSLTRWTIP
jgi:outer membrane protein assembly factor BamB